MLREIRWFDGVSATLTRRAGPRRLLTVALAPLLTAAALHAQPAVGPAPVPTPPELLAAPAAATPPPLIAARPTTPPTPTPSPPPPSPTATPVRAAAPPPTPETQPTAPPPRAAPLESSVGAEVALDGRALFTIRARLGPYTASERAAAVEGRLRELTRNPLAPIPEISVSNSGDATEILAGERVLVTVTDADARAAGLERQALAESLRAAIAGAVAGGRRTYSLERLAIGAALALLTTIALVVFLKGQRRFFAMVMRRVDGWRGTVIPSVRIQRLELLTSDRITDALLVLLRLARIAVIVFAVYFYIPLVFSFFPWTRGLAETLLGYVIAPVAMAWHGFIGSIPDLFVVAVVGVIAYYAQRIVRVLFAEIGKGTVTFPGFDPEWAAPTFKIVRFLILIFALIVAFPYLPGSGSNAFKGISLFLGLLLSLGSSSAVANIVAGVILTYTGAFRVGDRVRIADTVGDVVEKTLLVTRVRTVKNVDITVPNSMVMGSHIVNYSASAVEKGLILHTTVTIGYDVPWPQVHTMLKEAAGATEHVLRDPEPFVLQTALDDFAVAYELNAYTSRPDLMTRTLSHLHEHIQDSFNAAGVEIMSPHYTAVRDGQRVTVPDAFLPEGYEPPAFRVATPPRPTRTRARRTKEP